MKLIKPSVRVIDESEPFKRIEAIGRLCYKSEDKITEDSAKPFVKRLAERQHFAMLEHARVTFEIKGNFVLPPDILTLPAISYTSKVISDGSGAPARVQYLTLSVSHISQLPYDPEQRDFTDAQLILRMCLIAFYTKFTGAQNGANQRPGYCSWEADDGFLIEVSVVDDLKNIYNFDKHDYDVHGYMSIEFTCDRGVSHELVRHRVSVAQESTRYCNYSNDKFGHEITCVEPANYDEWSDDAKETFVKACESAETAYMTMVGSYQMTPQQARAVLPNALKTSVVLTMTMAQWRHFFDLRSLGTTGSPHPDMKVVADQAHQLYRERLVNTYKYIDSLNPETK